jgi:hypothetical protein
MARLIRRTVLPHVPLSHAKTCADVRLSIFEIRYHD